MGVGREQDAFMLSRKQALGTGVLMLWSGGMTPYLGSSSRLLFSICFLTPVLCSKSIEPDLTRESMWSRERRIAAVVQIRFRDRVTPR